MSTCSHIFSNFYITWWLSCIFPYWFELNWMSVIKHYKPWCSLNIVNYHSLAKECQYAEHLKFSQLRRGWVTVWVLPQLTTKECLLQVLKENNLDGTQHTEQHHVFVSMEVVVHTALATSVYAKMPCSNLRKVLHRVSYLRHAYRLRLCYPNSTWSSLQSRHSFE